MANSKPSSPVQIGQRLLVDANTMGAQIGFTGQYLNRMADQGKVPWVGIKNGKKIHRRFDPAQVIAALAHGTEV
jgi:hypothetical protein